MELHKVISIVNQKGGVGKTTTAFNMASWLKLFAKVRVLVIDGDGQSNLTACMKLDKENTGHSLYDLLTDEDLKVEDVIYHNDNLLYDVIVADERLNNIDLTLNGYMDRERQLAYKLESVKNNYDFIIIDCSPSLNLATINSLVASDYVLIPVQSDYLSIRGTAKLLESIDKIKQRMNRNLDILGVFITMYDGRKSNDKNLYETIQNQFGEKAFKTYIRENVRLKESPMYNKSIFEYDIHSNGSIDYNNLFIEIWERLGGQVKK